MKKIISLILLSIISLFLFTGCGNKIDENTLTSDEGIWYVKADPSEYNYNRYYKFVTTRSNDSDLVRIYVYYFEYYKGKLEFDGGTYVDYFNNDKDNEFIFQTSTKDMYTFNKEDCNNNLLIGTYINKRNSDNLPKTIKFERVKDQKNIDQINKLLKKEQEKHKND